MGSDDTRSALSKQREDLLIDAAEQPRPTMNTHTKLFPQPGTQVEQGAVGGRDGADFSENIIRLLEVPVFFFFFHLIKGTYEAPTLKHPGTMLVLRIKA